MELSVDGTNASYRVIATWNPGAAAAKIPSVVNEDKLQVDQKSAALIPVVSY